ncbi:MAG: hypothetical protein GY795_19755 [Desulfobacterales bacterium]|nr:hypothetical protein [Desulfobacterales bacterium]
MENYTYGPLEIVLEQKENETEMSWRGQSIQSNPGVTLRPYLFSLIDDLIGNNLTIEFSTLEYMNSSTVPPIVHFMKELNSNGIRTTITYDEEIKWQKASFKALEVLSEALDNVTVKAS